MEVLSTFFIIGLLFGLGAGALAQGRVAPLVGIICVYAVSLASVGFVGMRYQLSVLPYLVPWVLAPAVGSMLGGAMIVLMQPGVLADLLREPVIDQSNGSSKQV